MSEVKNDFDIEKWAQDEVKLYKSLISEAKLKEHNQQSITFFGQRYKKVCGYYVNEDSFIGGVYTIIKEDQIQKEWMEAVKVYLDTENKIAEAIEYQEQGKYENASRHSNRPITGLRFDTQGRLLKPVYMFGSYLSPEEAIKVVNEKDKEIQDSIRKLKKDRAELNDTKSRITDYISQHPNNKPFLSKDTLMPIDIPEHYRKMFNAAKDFNSINK